MYNRTSAVPGLTDRDEALSRRARACRIEAIADAEHDRPSGVAVPRAGMVAALRFLLACGLLSVATLGLESTDVVASEAGIDVPKLTPALRVEPRANLPEACSVIDAGMAAAILGQAVNLTDSRRSICAYQSLNQAFDSVMLQVTLWQGDELRAVAAGFDLPASGDHASSRVTTETITGVGDSALLKTSRKGMAITESLLVRKDATTLQICVFSTDGHSRRDRLLSTARQAVASL